MEDLLIIRGTTLDHATIQIWVFKFTLLNDQNFRKLQAPVNSHWRIDETDIKVNGKLCYLHQAVDKEQKTIGFLLTHQRKKRTAHRFLTKAITQNGIVILINIDRSESNKETIRVYNRRNYTKMKYRQCLYHNKIHQTRSPFYRLES